MVILSIAQIVALTRAPVVIQEKTCCYGYYVTISVADRGCDGIHAMVLACRQKFQDTVRPPTVKQYIGFG